jgi:2-polyprenyl-3-methyl-5-hydroxy-6-metoxy-1,4-benzoquinol methylase
MSLSKITGPNGQPIALPEPPVAASALTPLVGVTFSLPLEDPWLRERGSEGHAYLDGARSAWEEHPEWMDFLDPESPCHELKSAERDLYAHWWKPYIRAGQVLDLGCGIGRITTLFLDAGATVTGVDGDMKSLRRCAWHAAGRAGALELRWTSATKLPELADLDVVVAAEVLCYVPDHRAVLQDLVARLKPGGVLLLSMEARWGWALGADAPAGGLEAALSGSAVIDLPGDRWVHTYTRDELEELLTGLGLEVQQIIPSHYLPDGPLEDLATSLTLEGLLEAEERARLHPVWGPLNRLWLAAATVPT